MYGAYGFIYQELLGEQCQRLAARTPLACVPIRSLRVAQPCNPVTVVFNFIFPGAAPMALPPPLPPASSHSRVEGIALSSSKATASSPECDDLPSTNRRRAGTVHKSSNISSDPRVLADLAARGVLSLPDGSPAKSSSFRRRTASLPNVSSPCLLNCKLHCLHLISLFTTFLLWYPAMILSLYPVNYCGTA